MKFVFVLLDDIYSDVLEQAARRVRTTHGLPFEHSLYIGRDLKEGSVHWARLERDLATADLVFANMIVYDEQALPFQDMLSRTAHAGRSVVVLNSMPSLMKMNHLGDFEFQDMLKFVKSGPVQKVANVFSGLRKPKPEADAPNGDDEWDADDGELRRKKVRKESSKGMHKGMIAMMRALPAVLKLLPGDAKHLRAYLLFMQYWLNGSADNIENMLLFAIDSYVTGGHALKLKIAAPIVYPRNAIFHPDLPNGKTFTSRRDYDKWLAGKHKKGAATRARVGLITQRSFFLTGNHDHIDALIRKLETLGLDPVACYAAGLDFRPAVEEFFVEKDKATIDMLLNVAGFSLVGGGAESDAPAGIAQLRRLGVPYQSIIPLFFQTVEEWRDNDTGLNPVQAALNVALPELDGAAEPRVYAGTPAGSEDKHVLALPEMARVANRVARLSRLSSTANADKKIAVVLFNFPPNKGNVGTAAYLAVFDSLHALLLRLQSEGYSVGDIPATPDELRVAVIEGNSAAYGSTVNVADHLSADSYMRLFPAYSEIEKQWGGAPGSLLTDKDGIRILGRRFGNVLVGVQPSFGYEDDPMRLLMAKGATPHHGFAGFYAYLDKVFAADALVHFGTHGSLEFMPGKQIGLTAECWPDRLIGDLPHFYIYSVNNPSEGTIAKRRGFATLISYLSPPMESAGLYKNLIGLKDTIGVYRKARAEGAKWEENLTPQPPSLRRKEAQTASGVIIDAGIGGVAAADGGSASDDSYGNAGGILENLYESIREQAGLIELEPAADVSDGTPTAKERYIAALYNMLIEIEERLIPTGLHIMGKLPSVEELADMLTAMSAFDRSEEAATALPVLIARGLGYDYEETRKAARTDTEALARFEQVGNLHRRAVGLFVSDLAEHPQKPGARGSALLKDAAGVDEVESSHMFTYLQRTVANLNASDEIGAVVHALGGGYIEPSPGNDVVRNPGVLPTGRNIHGLDPQIIPSAVARRSGERRVRALLERALAESGEYPETTAIVLWGTDNIKSDGEGVAQVLAFMGVKPISDGLGRVNGVKLIDLDALKRPRLDVVVTVSGIFRDLMGPQMALMDKAVRLAAQADEPEELNFVKKHVNADMRDGRTFDEAVARVFSNAAGSYGANTNFMIESSSWQDEAEISDMFLTRKGFAYGVKSEGDDARALMERALSRVTLSFQNVDSAELGITDIDHYFEYLGGVTKSVEKLSGKRPKVLMSDAASASSGTTSNGIRSLEEMVRLETRTKTLNPKWYEGMLAFGYEGVREIETRVGNTFGWSVTAKAVDKWVYDGITQTYVLDEAMRARLQNMNVHALSGIVGRLLEANGRGYWQADEDLIDQLKEIYAGLEDEIEGIGAARTADGRKLNV